MKVVDALKSARNILVIKQNWAQGEMAKDVHGEAVTALDEKAVSWDLSGAIYIACKGEQAVYKSAFRAFRVAAGTDSISQWNDHPERTHEEVLAALDETIKMISGDGF